MSWLINKPFDRQRYNFAIKQWWKMKYRTEFVTWYLSVKVTTLSNKCKKCKKMRQTSYHLKIGWFPLNLVVCTFSANIYFQKLILGLQYWNLYYFWWHRQFTMVSELTMKVYLKQMEKPCVLKKWFLMIGGKYSVGLQSQTIKLSLFGPISRRRRRAKAKRRKVMLG